jgi:hypothetical protein
MISIRKSKRSSALTVAARSCGHASPFEPGHRQRWQRKRETTRGQEQSRRAQSASHLVGDAFPLINDCISVRLLREKLHKQLRRLRHHDDRLRLDVLDGVIGFHHPFDARLRQRDLRQKKRRQSKQAHRRAAPNHASRERSGGPISHSHNQPQPAPSHSQHQTTPQRGQAPPPARPARPTPLKALSLVHIRARTHIIVRHRRQRAVQRAVAPCQNQYWDSA